MKKNNWITKDSGSFEDFKSIVEQQTQPEDWEHAVDVQKNVLIYSGDAVRSACEAGGDTKLALMSEWTSALSTGPGVIVIKDALQNKDVIDKATEIFTQLIDDEKAAAGGQGKGDHFAKPGANDRVWNAVQKHCLADPANFADYFASEAIDLVCRAWLGDGYQMTAQINRVNPGGNAQVPHRDYHLGFMSKDRMELFPAHVHRLSPMLTLQGAVAHVDMPLEAGPTLYLPYSQQYFEGYLAFGRPQFQDYFQNHHVQLPLAKGDAAFFNPALMHGAGNNISSDIYRTGNLLQISSAFGRAMESVDRAAMIKALYPALSASSLSDRQKACAIAASAEAYSFPTNLDLDPPVGGLAPKTQAQMLNEALASGESADDFNAKVDALEERRKA